MAIAGDSFDRSMKLSHPGKCRVHIVPSVGIPKPWILPSLTENILQSLRVLRRHNALDRLRTAGSRTSWRHCWRLVSNTSLVHIPEIGPIDTKQPLHRRIFWANPCRCLCGYVSRVAIDAWEHHPVGISNRLN